MRNTVVSVPEHNIRIRIRWSPDLYSEPSDWLGQYTNEKPSGVYVDRKYGFLLGLPKTVTFETSNLFTVEAETLRQGVCDEEPDYEKTESGWRVTACGPEILSRDFTPFQYDSLRQYRYWVPTCYTDNDFYSDLDEIIRYAKEDFWRHETFGHFWTYLICEVVFEVSELEIGAASVCAVESDGGDAYHLEIVEGLLRSAIEDARKNYLSLTKLNTPFWSDDFFDLFMERVKNEV